MSPISSQSKAETKANSTVRKINTQDKIADDLSALLKLLQIESDIRRLSTEDELRYFLVNETRKVIGFRQAFLFRKKYNWSLEAVSSVTNFGIHSPINRQLVKYIAQLNGKQDIDSPKLVQLNVNEKLPALYDYIFPYAIWVPFKTRRGRVFSGLLLTHNKEWSEVQVPLVGRIAETAAHSWQALIGPSLESKYRLSRKLLISVLAGACLALGFIQAPLTVLAPVEVSGQDKVAVAVPLDGIIESIEVEPNQMVEIGTVLARFENTELKNALDISEREVTVAQARLAQLQSASFFDRVAGREVKVAEAQLALANDERELAMDRLARVEVTAKTYGIAILGDPDLLTGRPVSIGEHIMEIVSPELLEFTIYLPVADSIVLEDGNKVRIYLDSDPINPIDAVLTRTSYRATTQADGSFAYSLIARANDETQLKGLRIGSYGTAQLFGEEHSLFYIVFRRPLSWLRQNFGV